MKLNLDEVEACILGSLIEKEMTTPEQYPLSLNALTSACNQKSNRDPAMSLGEEDVIRGLDRLGSRGMARLTTTGGRVARYRHSLADMLGISPSCLAVLAELLLRGPQTPGELRIRAERMTPLPDLAAVETALAELQGYAPRLVTVLPRQPGRREQRYAHLLSGEPCLPADEPAPPPERTRQRAPAENDRMERLGGDISALRAEIAELRCLLAELKANFE